MNYVYCIYDKKNINNMVRQFLLSIDRFCKCKILFFYIDDIDKQENIIGNKIEWIRVPFTDWYKKRMFCKVCKISQYDFEYGDKVFVLDTDVILQDDIFKIFEYEVFDLGITSRHYQYWYPINGGVWCFRYNERLKQFLNFYVNQLLKPTWKPFIDFQRKFNHIGKLDWFCDQDFLCVLKNHNLPFNCDIKDIGYKYNFCPSVEDKVKGSFEKAAKEIIAQIGNNEYKILHFKGRLKELIENGRNNFGTI